MESPNLLFAAEISLCLKDIAVPKMFLEDALRKMAQVLKTSEDKESDSYKRLSYYAQILHSALLSINAAEDAVSGLAMLMTDGGKV